MHANVKGWVVLRGGGGEGGGVVLSVGFWFFVFLFCFVLFLFFFFFFLGGGAVRKTEVIQIVSTRSRSVEVVQRGEI